MHSYLKKQRTLTKVFIGRFYIVIDYNFEEKASRPDNVYRFVESIVSSKRCSEDPMLYNISIVKSTQSMLKACSRNIKELNKECEDFRRKYVTSRSKLKDVNRTLRKVNNENNHLKQQYKHSKLRVDRLKEKNEHLELECVQLQIENFDLQDELHESDSTFQYDECESTFQEIIGDHGRYSPAIRQLYYSLLTDQVPVSKVKDIIQAVLKCFNASMNIDELRLPKKSCASYMRKNELKIISDAHKAHVFCNDASEGKGLLLNTDGTTKQQKKLNGAVVNDMVLSVNEVADGKAITAVEDLSKEFSKLRRVAEMLGLPNADMLLPRKSS